MGRAVLIAVAVAVGAFAQGATAVVLVNPEGQPTQTITVVNEAGVGARALARIERAVQYQANMQLRPWWHTPPIRFGSGGWPVVLIRSLPSTLRCGEVTCSGYHFRGASPSALVATDTGPDFWPYMFSHELMEMLAAREICDPLTGLSYSARGVGVADFILPRWYRPGSHGPWDAMRNLTRAGQTTLG